MIPVFELHAACGETIRIHTSPGRSAVLTIDNGQTGRTVAITPAEALAVGRWLQRTADHLMESAAMEHAPITGRPSFGKVA